MADKDHWLLPEGIEDVLPPQAERLEWLRRDLLDLFHGWGYELVIPPLVEYLESLLSGMSRDLDLQTFKLTDQLTGRLMGVRADMTPQVARIDAHHLKRNAPVRLCYLGTVLHTRPDGFARSRNPLQVGAELYGHAGIESDIEILCLMQEVLTLTGVSDAHLDLGHVGIFRGLAREAGLDAAHEVVLFDALQRKAMPEMQCLLAELRVTAEQRQRLLCLAELNGGVEVLAEAESVLHGAGAEVKRALADLQAIAQAAGRYLPEAPLHFDLGELRGYHYHTGVVFAAFVPGHGQAVAQGGRYDVGHLYGQPRPATGFSADLKTLIALCPDPAVAHVSGILAPWSDDPVLRNTVRELRENGERVIWALPGQQGDATELGCDRRLEQYKGEWTVVETKDTKSG